VAPGRPPPGADGAAPDGDGRAAAVARRCAAAAAVARGIGHAELAAALDAASARARRHTAIVAVVGEYKHGKSALVNAVVGAPVCPVDDDRATRVLTLVHPADARSAVVRRRSSDGRSVRAEAVELGAVREWALEDSAAPPRDDVERVEIGVPSPVLARGLVLVDTPGVGGLHSGHLDAVVALLPLVDAVILCTDAGAGLTRSEIELLRRMQAHCPTLLVAVTKFDLHPAGAEVVADVTAAATAAVGAVPVVATSATVAHVAAPLAGTPLGDELAAESGIPALIDALDAAVLARSRRSAAARAVDELHDGIARLGYAVDLELAVLDDVDRAADVAAAATATAARVARLGSPDARWAIALRDGAAALRLALDRQVRADIDRVTQVVAATIASPTALAGAEADRALRGQVAELAAVAQEQLRAGLARLGATVATILAEELAEATAANPAVAPPADGGPVAGLPVLEAGHPVSELVDAGPVPRLVTDASVAVVVTDPASPGSVGWAPSSGEEVVGDAGAHLQAVLDGIGDALLDQVSAAIGAMCTRCGDGAHARLTDVSATAGVIARHAAEAARSDPATRDARAAALRAARFDLAAIADVAPADGDDHDRTAGR
jgi:hypothetical protein